MALGQYLPPLVNILGMIMTQNRLPSVAVSTARLSPWQSMAMLGPRSIDRLATLRSPDLPAVANVFGCSPISQETVTPLTLTYVVFSLCHHVQKKTRMDVRLLSQYLHTIRCMEKATPSK